MAKKDTGTSNKKTFGKLKVKRKGVHSKKKNSKLKNSKNYRKKYNKQGR